MIANLRSKIARALSKKCERVAGLYLNDDLRNGALMADIGCRLIGLCAVKGYISSVGEGIFRGHSGIIPGKSGVGKKAHPRLYLYRGLGMRDKQRRRCSSNGFSSRSRRFSSSSVNATAIPASRAPSSRKA